MPATRFLLIEDDPMIGQGIERALQDIGYSGEWVQDGASADAAIVTHEYSMILLDLGLPDKSGIEILVDLRASGDRTPLLIITARDEIDDRVRGLDLGADDYLVKPFGLGELMARIRAILRRREDIESNMLSNGEISLNPETHEASYRGKTLLLSPREYDMLYALIERPGTILSRRQIEERIYKSNDDVSSNAVEVLIHYLRKKFDNEIIRNVRGVGWMVVKHPI